MVWSIFDRDRRNAESRGRSGQAPRRLRKRREQLAVRDRESHHVSLGGEWLENRAMLAAFTYDSVAESLTIDLDNTNEAITLTSTGGGDYVFTSTNTFTGTNTTGLSGATTNTLTITSALTLADIFVTDSATGTSVSFGTSTGSYVDNLGIALNTTPGNVTVAQSTTFAGSSTLSALANNVVLTAALTMGTGSVTLTAASTINGAGTLTADSLALAAATGIGNTTALSLAAPTISATSTAGKINVANALGTAVTVTSLTTQTAVDPGGALITFNQSGGGTVTFNNVSAAGTLAESGWGVITLANAGGGITIAGTGVTNAGTTSTITLTITGTLSGTAGDQYRVQYFSSLASDATTAAAVQGRLLLGYEDVTISGGGTTVIDKVFAQGDILVNDWASATATLLVSGTPKNTSPFALGRKVV